MENNEHSLVITDVQKPAPKTPASVYSSIEAMAEAQRIGNALCASSFVPDEYQGQQNMANVLVALELANRMQVSPFMVMQNLHVIHGKPSWSSQYMIAMINGSGRFNSLRFEVSGSWANGDLTCYAYATEKASGEVLRGTTVTQDMAKAEGWASKRGSKWQTMPELMITYRAAAFWARVYVPEMLMGFMTQEENEDIGDTRKRGPVPASAPAPEVTKVEVVDRVDNPEQPPTNVDPFDI